MFTATDWVCETVFAGDPEFQTLWTAAILRARRCAGDPQGKLHRIRRILAQLSVSRVPQDMRIPGFRLHPLKGEMSGYWSIRVSSNWRIIFRFENGDALGVDLADYH